ncbi:MAG: UDP-N-acetylmuramoyl-L-alanyl-D-glutamate--2,6-diaminopimelate ligase [Syntrophaceae bacterium]|nr:UDP-N-acetylmuramoyl-L-alanyl-D-glutamate--2,6-diaminopimelate ligase [Syntrophaceae bacterium]
MDLLDLLENVDVLEVHGTRAREIEGICYDSRRCGEDSLFVAVRGARFDGHLFVPEAVRRGARAVVYDREIARHAGYTAVRVRDSRRALGVLGRNFFGNPSGSIGLVGVTGTNGKTTVTYLLESILREAGHEPGVIGTVNYRWGSTLTAASHTTPESFELQRLLAEIRDAGVTHVVMEVSSHALELRRVEDCAFDLGVFMNLSQDHLDFHGTMEAYYASKKRFFTDLLAGEKNGRPQGRIINLDDPWGRRLAGELGAKGLTTFGIDSIAFVQAGTWSTIPARPGRRSKPRQARFRSGRPSSASSTSRTSWPPRRRPATWGSRCRRSSGASRPPGPSRDVSRGSARRASPPSSSTTPTRRTPCGECCGTLPGSARDGSSPSSAAAGTATAGSARSWAGPPPRGAISS